VAAPVSWKCAARFLLAQKEFDSLEAMMRAYAEEPFVSLPKITA